MMIKINQMSKENGFTLIELIIVIVILGILAAVGIPRFMNSRADAIASSCRSNRAALDDAVERYRFEEGDINALTGGGTTWQSELVDGEFIKAAYVCPFDNQSTAYTINGSGVVSCGNVTNGSHPERSSR